MAGPIVATRSGALADALTSYGDIVPTATLRWNQGVNNYMVYITGDIPAGDYSPTRLANLGIGHGTVDAGGAYTYLNPATGNEFSATAGFTYNFKNPDTQYRVGIDFHFDWGAAHFISKQIFVGLAGYAYQQITDDSGQNPILGGFRSRVYGIGPQIGYIFPMGDMEGFLGLRGYADMNAVNRAPGLEHLADLRDFAGRAYCGETNQESGDEIAYPNHADIGSIPFAADSSQVIRHQARRLRDSKSGDARSVKYRRTSLADEQTGSRGRNNQVRSPCINCIIRNISDAGVMLDVTKPAEVSDLLTLKQRALRRTRSLARAPEL